MNNGKCILMCFLAISLFSPLVTAQQISSSADSAVVPRLANFTGKATDAQG